MTEEKNGLSHGPVNSEMAPQEDGTKVPLTDEPGQVKFSSSDPPNGDAKIVISDGPTFSGLTKDELMKYADDPFWVRLRWALFIIFWAGWVAMLVMAIIIIVQTPRCAPKETLEWVQESAMIQYDMKNPVDANGDGTETPEDLILLARELGMKTVYLEDLISTYNFENMNNIYDNTDVLAVIEAAKKEGLHVVTDFVPATVPETNTWYTNSSLADFFIPNTKKLDFSNEGLLSALIELFSTTWKDRGVLGYLAAEPVDEILANATVTLTEGLDSVDGAVVHGLTDVNSQLNFFTPESYKVFLEDHIGDDWSYFKFNPNLAESSLGSKAVAKLVTMTLFLVPGTPILHGVEEDYYNAEKGFIEALSEFREKESVQVGGMTFVNTTSEDVIAFARVMKGTPGCAVAANFHHDNSTEVDFTSITGVPSKGDMRIQVTNATHTSGELGRMELSKVFLNPLEGVVVLFVPNLE